MATGRSKHPRKKSKGKGKGKPAKAGRTLGVRFAAAQRTNKNKLELLRRINDHTAGLKNRMSAYVFANLPRLLANAYELGLDCKLFDSPYLNAWERQALFQDVISTYQRRLAEIQGRYAFGVQNQKVGWTCEKYVRKTERNGKLYGMPGWAKPGTFVLKMKRSNMARAANILLRTNLPKFDVTKFSEKSREVLEPLMAQPAKWARLLVLVAARQVRLLGKFKCHAFRTGTHRLNAKESRAGVIRDKSNGKYQWFFEFRSGSGPGAELVRIPLAFDKRYFTPKVLQNAREFVVKVEGKKVLISGVRQAPELVFKEKGKLIGVDANTKHNLLATSEPKAYDYNRVWLDLLITALLKLDAKGSKNLSHRDKGRLAKYVRRNEAMLQRRIHEILGEFNAAGITDLVMEDLGQFKGTLLSRHPEFEQKYTRILRLLRLSSIKDMVNSQAEKLGIRVHLTHAAYSSQECPACHHTSRGNRPIQERFCCEECGYEAPADFVSADNLANRLTSDVLREKLHEFDKFGRASPRKMSRSQLKGIVTSQAAGGVIDSLTPALPNKELGRRAEDS